MSGPVQATLRLAGFAAAVALVTSRIGLVVHELVGHGGAATVVGAGVDEVRLFWFAGGWIHYDRAVPWTLGEVLVVQLAGIGVQLAIGAAALVWARRRSGWLGVAVTGAATGWVVHAAAYLAIGTWHGFGDGSVLHRALGAWRPIVAIPAAAIAVGVAFLAARALTGRLAAAIPAPSRAGGLAAVAAAVAAAGGINVALVRAELAIRDDATYGAIMRPERDRAIDRELAAWLAEQRARGILPDADALERERRARERARPTFPFGALVIGAIALAGIAGAATSRARDHHVLDRRTLAGAGIAVLAALAAVIAAAAVFPL